MCCAMAAVSTKELIGSFQKRNNLKSNSKSFTKKEFARFSLDSFQRTHVMYICLDVFLSICKTSLKLQPVPMSKTLQAACISVA